MKLILAGRLSLSNTIKAIKVRLSMECEFRKESPKGEESEIKLVELFSFKDLLIKNKRDIDKSITMLISDLQKDVDDFTATASGWIYICTTKATLTCSSYFPFKGSSYFKTPDYVPPRSVIIVKNKDNQCFKWTILTALYPPA